MSLDVYLHEVDPDAAKCACAGACPCHQRHEEVYSANITHNCGGMAGEAGIYYACWRPEEVGITHAKQLIEPLEMAIAVMLQDPERFEKHNAPNGWGLYEHFVPWLKRYLEACRAHPAAVVSVSR